MRYRNRITGIVISTTCAISGPDFEEIRTETEAPKVETLEEPKKEPEAPKKVAKPVKRVKK